MAPWASTLVTPPMKPPRRSTLPISAGSMVPMSPPARPPAAARDERLREAAALHARAGKPGVEPDRRADDGAHGQISARIDVSRRRVHRGCTDWAERYPATCLLG